MATLYPSLFASDLLHLGDTIEQFDPLCAGYHLDIMDGHFVPNIGFGLDVVHAIAKASKRALHIHLMVDNPLQFIDQMNEMKTHFLTSFHIESNCNPSELINIIYKKNMKAGLAISPKTPVNELLPFLGMVNQVLLMSVEPGFSGQSFLEASLDRLNQLVAYRSEKKLSFSIAMDGGINKTNINKIIKYGVDECVIGSAIFKEANPIEAFKEINGVIH